MLIYRKLYKQITFIFSLNGKCGGLQMMNVLQMFVNKFLRNLFGKKKHIKLGLYGPPNAGKTTLANRICQDWLGEEMGTVSNIPHETREIQIKEKINNN